MDTEARIEAARARLEASHSALVQSKHAAPVCARCAFYVRESINRSKPRRAPHGPYCGHPVYSQHQFEPATGLVRQEVEVPVTVARAPEGLCGPEAILFEHNSLGVPALADMGRKTFMGAVIFFAVGGFLGFLELSQRLLTLLW